MSSIEKTWTNQTVQPHTWQQDLKEAFVDGLMTILTVFFLILLVIAFFGAIILVGCLSILLGTVLSSNFAFSIKGAVVGCLFFLLILVTTVWNFVEKRLDLSSPSHYDEED
jgi:hypothetical protein